MSMSDPIADMLTRIRNAQMVKKISVIIPMSKVKVAIAQVLKDEGYIDNFSVKTIEGLKAELNIGLKYYAGHPVITSLKRASKPGLRIYRNHKNIPQVMNGFGITIISTTKGMMADRKARVVGVGGEIICYVS
ncbi:MAG: 30S ribosomal protein S8 [Burkholderia sp.]|nr:30S ribosomal protein S8 [Burkholderia sp.]